MQQVLCTRHAVGSWLLRAVLCSRWSHSAVYDDERGLVYEATAWHGVRCVDEFDFFLEHQHFELDEMPVLPERLDECRQWLAAQVGKRYDWTAIFGFVVRYFTGDQWHDDDAWFCSELSEACRSRFAQPRVRAEAWRVTPATQDLLI